MKDVRFTEDQAAQALVLLVIELTEQAVKEVVSRMAASQIDDNRSHAGAGTPIKPTNP